MQNIKRVFSLVHAERLSFSVCEKALQQLDNITQGQGGISAILCMCIFIEVTLYHYLS